MSLQPRAGGTVMEEGMLTLYSQENSQTLQAKKSLWESGELEHEEMQ